MGNRGSGKADHTSQKVNSDLQPSFPTMHCCRRFYWKKKYWKHKHLTDVAKVAYHYGGNQPLSYWIWGLIHRRNFTPGNAKLGQKIILGTAQALGAEPTIVMLNCHVVKLPSITLMPIVLLSLLIRSFFFFPCNG